MQLAPYLYFDGTCEEALTFYAAVFGGTTTDLNRFADSPMSETMPADQRRRIMHCTFSAPGISFMASDSSELASGAMRRVSLAIAGSDAAEGQRVFDALAEGGTISVPYTKQFWGASFGMLVDRYGINWTVNAGR